MHKFDLHCEQLEGQAIHVLDCDLKYVSLHILQNAAELQVRQLEGQLAHTDPDMKKPFLQLSHTPLAQLEQVGGQLMQLLLLKKYPCLHV